MKAARLKGKLNASVENVDKPSINEDEILVKIKAASICGTDVRMFNNGYRNVSEDNALTLGHEFSGVIEKVGSRVERYRVGQRVAISPNFGCGTCNHCVNGETHICEVKPLAFGINIDGALAEYVKIPTQAIRQGNVIVLQENISFEEAALLEPLSCVYNGQKMMNLSPGFDLLVIGAGPIGIMHIMLARLFGASKIFVSDLSEDRLKQIKVMFPDVITVNTNIKEKIKEVTGKGVDVCIVAAPSAIAQMESLAYMNMHGKLLFFGGLPKDKENVSLNMNLLHYNQLAIYGCTKQSISDYRTCAKLVTDKLIPLDWLVSHRYTIDEFDEALINASNAKGLKHVLIFE